MRKKLLLLLLAACACLLSAGRASACSCGGPGEPCVAFGAASAVFVGTVTGSRTPPRSGREDGHPHVYRFSVAEAFSGVEGAEAEVATGTGGGDCGYEFRRGETYLVYAYRTEKGAYLATGICTRTRPLAEAAPDLDFLRALPGRAAGVIISGAVERVRQRVTEDDSVPLGGVADAALVVEGEGVRRELRADARGRFSVNGLKPGAYKLKLSLPEELTTYQPERELRVSDRGCAVVLYTVVDNGRVSGTLTDAEGEPAGRVLLTLYEADEANPLERYGRLERAEEDGRYSFEGLPPGRYRLAVNLTRFPEAGDVTGAFPRTYYPGVAQASESEVIVVGEGEHVRGRDWHLPPRRAEVAAEVAVVWSDGRPVAHAEVTFRDVTYHDPGMNNAAQADAEGRFILKGFEGQTFVVEARSNRPAPGDPRRDGPAERAEPLRVTLSDTMPAARIVVTRLR